MNPSSLPPVKRRSALRRWLWGLLAAFLLLLVVLAAGVVSCFHLDSDTRVLRNALIKSGGIEWRQQIALNAGHLTMGAVRAGLSYAKLDPGARVVLQSVQTAGVGIYQLPAGTKPPDRAAMLAAADSAMTARGWERMVGVMDAKNLVAVYLPKQNTSVQRMKCCVMVFDGNQMVLVSTQANLEPLLKYALDQLAVHTQARRLTQH